MRSAVTAAAQPISLKTEPVRQDNTRRFWRAFRRNRIALIGLALILVVAFAALFAHVIAPYDPVAIDVINARKPPSSLHLLGTDELGRDIFSRLVYGARISLVIGLVGESVALIIGSVVGALAGWYGGWVDDVLMRITDVFFAIPGLMFLIVFVSIVEPSTVSIFVALGIISWPSEARMMRSQVLSVKQLDYVTAAKALGASAPAIIWRHVVPNVLAPMIVLGTLGIAGMILSESILSFLGLGIQIPTPTWGTMVNIGQNYIFQEWWYAFFPGFVITLTVLGFNFLGDGLRDALDPTLYE
jgi:peptide/nickel transport system permease protein